MDRLYRIVVVCAFAAIAMAVVGTPLGAAAQRRPFYVAVTDSKGEPTAGLTAADLVVEVNGKAAAVASVAPAAEPVSIVVVTEGIRQDAISEIRKMMKAVVVGARAIHPDSRVGLMVEDGAASPKMLIVSSDVQKLDAVIGRFFESSKNAPLLDSILTAAQTLSFEQHARRIIIAVTRGQEDAQADVMSPVKVAAAVRGSGASLWALDLGGRDAPDGAAELRVLSDVTTISGGRRERSTVVSIASLTERIMATLRAQYAITLEDGFTLKAASPRVTARTRDLKILAPAWRADK
ncbi:MAG TPA: hypothetical protein VMZ90_06940 [Vicinamibacterales bacterium]|nr:hypothetical protein [Vicinamibacterales bacterium]